MATVIKVNTSEIDRRMEEMRKLFNEERIILNKFTRLILSIEDSWVGESQKAFIAKYAETMMLAVFIQDALTNSYVVIKKMEQEFTDVDRNIDNAIGADLFTCPVN